MADPFGVVTVSPPSNLYRVGRESNPYYFDSIDAVTVTKNNAGNRFSVPGAGVMYAATEAVGAYKETLQGFRLTAKSIATLRTIQPTIRPMSNLAPNWRSGRRLATFSVDAPFSFVDIEATKTQTVLTDLLANELNNLGIQNLDASTVHSDARLMTRAIALWAYQALDTSNNRAYSGIRYVSKMGGYHECWAIFSGSRIQKGTVAAIDVTDGTFCSACDELGISPQ